MFGLKFTGIGRCAYELVKHIISTNEKLENPHRIVLFFNKNEYHEFPESKTVKKILVNAQHYSLKEQTKFAWKLYKEKLNIVHFPHFNVPFLYRKPYTVTIHDLTLSLFPGNKMTKWYQRLAYHTVIRNAVRTAKKIIAVSENTKTDIIKMLHIPAKKIEVIYNGVSEKFEMIEDATKFQPTLKKYKITKEFLLYTGVWRSHKNLPRLVHAFSILKHKYHLNLQLVITGKFDPCYPEARHSVKMLNLEEDVIFTNAVDEDELVYLYNAALIYVLPSLYEGFGLPILESMKCGTPVAASNISSIPEICGEGNAILFDPYNIDDIAEKIDMLYKDTTLQADLVDRGLRRAAEFSWDRMSEKTYELITSAAGC
jgi:glycosyltransferase involved in cell wall biosynthesis